MERRLDDRLFDPVDLRFVGQLHRIIDHQRVTREGDDAVNHGCRRGDQAQAELALEPLAHDVHVQQAQKATAKTKAQRLGSLRLVSERRVVEPEFFERFAQGLILSGIRRIEAAENHRLHRFKARQRPACRPFVSGDRVADLGFGNFFDTGHHETDFARFELRDLHGSGRENTEAQHFERVTARHHANLCSFFHGAIEDTRHHNGAVIRIKPAIDNQSAQWRRSVSFRRRKVVHDPFEDFFGADPLFCARADSVGSIQPNDVFDLGSDALGLGAGKIDLVDHRQNFQVVIQRHVDVRDGLRLDPLGGIDDQQRALAGR